MPAFQIKDMPQRLYDDLKVQAEREHRSMAQQSVFILEQYLNEAQRAGTVPSFEPTFVRAAAQPEDEFARRRKVFEWLDAHEPIPLPDTLPTPAEIIREGRESR